MKIEKLKIEKNSLISFLVNQVYLEFLRFQNLKYKNPINLMKIFKQKTIITFS